MTNFLAKIFKDIQERKINKVKREQPEQSKNFTYSNQNAQSWNKETHPNGRGDSLLVKTIDYDEKNKNLDVEYRDGFKARYENIEPQLVKNFHNADSKGRFALKNLWKLDYRKV